jgi:hypothetical protein
MPLAREAVGKDHTLNEPHIPAGTRIGIAGVFTQKFVVVLSSVDQGAIDLAVFLVGALAD